MQLLLIFDKPKKVTKPKKVITELSKSEKFKTSVHNYFKLPIHQRLNLRTWLKYDSLRIFHEQNDCIDVRQTFLNEYYEYSWRQGHTKNEDNLQYGINQY